MQQGRAAERCGDTIPIARQERLPELLGLDRIADMRIERALVEAVFRQDGRQQEGAERAPFLVDVDRGLGGRDEFGESRFRRRQPSARHC